MAEPTHDGETLAETKDRFGDNLEDPFDRHRKSRGRYGWWDTLAGHSGANVCVALAREKPYKAGHWLWYALLYGAAMTIVAIIGWIN
jgi:hypothetical protein